MATCLWAASLAAAAGHEPGGRCACVGSTIALPPLDAAAGARTGRAAPIRVGRASSSSAPLAVKTDFDLLSENAAAVAEVCRRLDGLPLAIELAATRVRALTPAAMLRALDHRLPFLPGGPRDLPGPAAYASRRDRLELRPAERVRGAASFRRLGVLAGGATLEAVEAVCRPDEELGLDAVDGLEPVGPDEHGEKRKRVNPTESRGSGCSRRYREYARERLDGRAGAERGSPSRHAEFYLGAREDSESFWPPAETAERYRRLNLEADNLRAALDWAHETRSPLELRLAVLYQRSDSVFPAEGRARLERALANPAPPAAQTARPRACRDRRVEPRCKAMSRARASIPRNRSGCITTSATSAASA